jgi:hypothetical protein
VTKFEGAPPFFFISWDGKNYGIRDLQKWLAKAKAQSYKLQPRSGLIQAYRHALHGQNLSSYGHSATVGDQNVVLTNVLS